MTVAIKGDRVRVALAWSSAFWGLFVGAVLLPQPWSIACWVGAVALVAGTALMLMRPCE